LRPVTFDYSNNRIRRRNFGRHTDSPCLCSLRLRILSPPEGVRAHKTRLLKIMSTEYNPQQYQLNPNQTDYTTDPPWADLELTVPNDRSPISIVSFVECVLVELTHEPVAAEYTSSYIWGAKRTRFFPSTIRESGSKSGILTTDWAATIRCSVGGVFETR